MDGVVISTAKINVNDDVDIYAIWENIPEEPQETGDEVQPDPNYEHETVGGKEVYTDAIDLGKNVDLGTVFASAKAGNGVVKVDLSGVGVSLVFNEAAVDVIGGKAVTFNGNLIEGNNGIENLEGIQCVLEVSLVGSTFEGGSVTITIEKNIDVPEGKIVKVYYVNGATKTDMNCSYKNGVLTFDTDHFSSYAVVLENKPEGTGEPAQPVEPVTEEVSSEKGGLTGGAIAGIVIAIVVVLAGACVVVFFFLKKKDVIGGNKTNRSKTEDVDAKESDSQNDETKNESKE